MNQFKKINNEVFFTEKTITKIEDVDIKFLKANVKNTEKKRIRLCTHLSEEDKLQEMFILLSKETYIRPHKHLKKSESLHVQEGLADVVFFDDKSNITKIIFITGLMNPLITRLLLKAIILFSMKRHKGHSKGLILYMLHGRQKKQILLKLEILSLN